MSLDALVKDVEVQDVRDKNLNEKQLNAIYNDISNTKSTIETVINVMRVSCIRLHLLLLGGWQQLQYNIIV